MNKETKIAITGVGLTAPNANSYDELRKAVLAGRSGIVEYEIRYVGKTVAGVCDFDALKYQKRKSVRRGTRAGSVAAWSCNEALLHAGIDREKIDRSRIGIYLGITEHGNVETENEIYELSKVGYDIKYWTHHHNPRTVANNPAGEAALNMKITGPHYTIGGACAAGNLGIIQGVQQLVLGEVDLALAGGVSESIHTFGIFAAFKSQGALAENENPKAASRPFDLNRNGIVVSEGGAAFVLERLDDALARGANILGIITGYGVNTDATDFVLPLPERQAQCMKAALRKAGLRPEDVDIISTHGTATNAGDAAEAKAIREVFSGCENTWVNNTKSMIGHCMGAAGALEMAGNLPSFEDGWVHPTINCENPDPDAEIPKLVRTEPRKLDSARIILNNSFGMLGLNSCVVVEKFDGLE